ncbi:MAG: hypothetical protein ACREFX_00175, partial [Opitutaceae bacterium]
MDKLDLPIFMNAMVVNGGSVTASVWNVTLSSVGHFMLTVAGTDMVISSYFPSRHTMRAPLQNRDYSETLIAEGRDPNISYNLRLSNPEAALQEAIVQASKPTWMALPELDPWRFTNCFFGGIS